MSEHRFTVYVAVDLIQRPEGDTRTDAEFAESMLWQSPALRAERTDGWADCVGMAYVTNVEYEESRG